MAEDEKTIERACMAAWPDHEAVTEEMRSRMRAAIAVIEEIAALRVERDKLRAALEQAEKALEEVEIESSEPKIAHDAGLAVDKVRRALEKNQ